MKVEIKHIKKITIKGCIFVVGFLIGVGCCKGLIMHKERPHNDYVFLGKRQVSLSFMQTKTGYMPTKRVYDLKKEWVQSPQKAAELGALILPHVYKTRLSYPLKVMQSSVESWRISGSDIDWDINQTGGEKIMHINKKDGRII